MDQIDTRLGVRIMVIAEDIERLLMIFVGGVGQRFQCFGVTPRAARVFGRTHAVCVEQTGVADLRLSRGDALDLDAVFPSVTKVVQVTERLAAHTFERLSQRCLAGIERTIEAIPRVRDAKACAPERQFPQMTVGPGKDRLEDRVQAIKPDA